MIFFIQRVTSLSDHSTIYSISFMVAIGQNDEFINILLREVPIWGTSQFCSNDLGEQKRESNNELL